MSTLGFYFRGMTDEQANEMRARLNEIAAELGYTAERGPTAGEGNGAALMVAIAQGWVECRKVRQSCRDANEVFDALVGWSTIYPPADEWARRGLESAPEKYRDALETTYNEYGIMLSVAEPGERWTIELDEDWSVEFLTELSKLLPDEEEEDLYQAAYQLAADIERGTDDALQGEIEGFWSGDGTLHQGERWGWDGFRYWVRTVEE